MVTIFSMFVHKTAIDWTEGVVDRVITKQIQHKHQTLEENL